MALVTKEFNLNLAPNRAPAVLYASAGDVGRPFKALLYWGDTAWSATGTTCRLRGRKPDNTVFDYNVTVNDTSVTFFTTEQMCIVAGRVESELVFSDTSGNEIASANFVLIVEDSPFDPDALSESDVTGLSEMVAEQVSATIDDDISTALSPVLSRLTAVEGKATANETKNTQQDSRLTTLENDLADTDGNLDDLETRLKSGDADDANLHLDFYIDNDGDLCQLD